MRDLLTEEECAALVLDFRHGGHTVPYMLQAAARLGAERELLEAAARAAGIELRGVCDTHALIDGTATQLGVWNPLHDDGDALRLAVKLGLTVGPSHGATYATIAPCPDDFEDGNFPIRVAHIHNDDPYAATRRAITRAAAEIGRAS